MATTKIYPGGSYRINSTGQVKTVSETGSARVNPKKVTILSMGTKPTDTPPQNTSDNNGDDNSQDSSAGNFDDPNFAGATDFSNDQLEKLLKDSGLLEDEQELLRNIFNIADEGNQQEAQRMIDALKLGAEYSNPIFRFKARLIEDSLTRSVNNLDDDLEFREKQLKTALDDLKDDVAYSKDFLDLTLQTELGQIEREFEQNLKQLQNQMSDTGFTRSSRRNREESLRDEVRGELVESKERSFGAQQRELTNNEQRASRDTQSEIERLQELTRRGKVDLKRDSETQLGTDFAKDFLPGLDTIGGDDDPFGGGVEFDRKAAISQFI